MLILQRQMAEPLKKTIAESPIVYLNGPRQTGKSWLTQNLNLGQDINYITFDSPFQFVIYGQDKMGRIV